VRAHPFLLPNWRGSTKIAYRSFRVTHAIGEDIGEVSKSIGQFQQIIRHIQQIQTQLTSTIEAQTTDL
jgi:hypothetical protein